MKSQTSILLIEDDYFDAMMVKRAFKKLKVCNRLDIAVNGEEALKFLRDNNNHKPDIILLDLNMPRINGIEFLRIAKQDTDLKNIPVIVLTTSSEDQDIKESFRLSVAGYIIKPANFQRYVDVMKTVDMYWTLCEMPR